MSGLKSNGPLCLSIECSTTFGSVALIRGPGSQNEEILRASEWTRDRSHSENLGPELEKVKKFLPELEYIAVGCGPGSFTGIRVGINAARALGWSLSKPVIPVTSTQNILAAATATGDDSDVATTDIQCLVALPAQMGLVFAQWDGVEVFAATPAEVCDRFHAGLNAKGRVFVLGAARESLLQPLRALGLDVKTETGPEPKLDFPTALTGARLAAAKVAQIPSGTLVSKFNWLKTQPLYLRGSGAEEKRA